nr:Ig-like domain-containing protein [uncultured Allomuricauda sp.]
MKRIARNYLAYSIIVAASLLVSCNNEENNEATFSEIKLNKSVLGIFIGETFVLTTTSDTESSIKWSSNKSDIATVNSEGLVTGISEGTAIITSESGNAKAICTVVISKKTFDLELNNSNLRLFPDPKYAETLEVLTDVEGNNITWESTNPEVAVVDENGLVTPIALGETKIIAGFDEFFTECLVEVVEGPVTAIELDKTQVIMKTFKTDQLTIVNVASELEEIGTPIWESSNPDIVSIDDEGSLTSFGEEGNATISVTIDNLTIEVPVTVTPAVVYVAGWDNGKKAVLWKNGEEISLNQGVSEAESVHVTDENNVYISGHVGSTNNRTVTVWNDTGSELYKLTNGNEDARGKGVLYDDGTNTLYTVGYEDNEEGRKIAKIWQDGQILHELTDGSEDALADDIVPHNGSLYSVGYERNPNTNRLEATVWQDGMKLYTLTDSGFESRVYGVEFIGNDIYTAGYERNPDSDIGRIAKVWINDEELYVYPNKTRAYDMYVYAGDIYVAGRDDEPGPDTAIIWRNGSVLYELTDGTKNAATYSVYVTENGDIYATGFEENENGDEVAKVWKNGEVHLTLSDGNNDARGLSIVVK